MSYNLEGRVYVIGGEPIPIVELTNAELRQAITDLATLVVDTNGENDQFVVLIKEELDNRGETINKFDENE